MTKSTPAPAPASAPRRFLYHAEAVALAARFTRPWAEVVESQAASVLPTSGGLGRARVEAFRHRDLVSFRAAHTMVTGNESHAADGSRTCNTLATATIEGLNIADVVTADAVVARLVSENSDTEDDLPVVPVGSHFVNLRIAGVPVEPKPRGVLFRCGTLTQIAGDLPKEKTPIVDAAGDTLRVEPLAARRPAASGAPSVYEDRRFLTSIFEPAAALAAGCTARTGGGILVPGFGTVYLGELLVTRYSRRLSMVRVEMGSPVQGDAEAGVVGGNGSWYP